MDIKSIEYFLRTYQLRNITKAASELFISQQGLSKAMRALELELGVPLFTRSKSGAEPTEYADAIYSYAKGVQDNYLHIQSRINQITDSHRGAIRVGIVNGAISALPVGRIIYDFYQLYPNITVTLRIEPDYTCENLLSENKIDIAILIMPVENSKINYSVISSYPTYVCMRKNESLAKKPRLVLNDLKDIPLITVDERFKMHHALKRVAGKKGIKLNLAYQTTQLQDMLNLAASGLGVPVFSKLWIEADSSLNTPLEMIELSEPDLQMTFCLCYSDSRMRTPNERLLFDYMAKMLSI